MSRYYLFLRCWLPHSDSFSADEFDVCVTDDEVKKKLDCLALDALRANKDGIREDVKKQKAARLAAVKTQSKKRRGDLSKML